MQDKKIENYERIVVFDVETTGFNPEDCDVIEFAAVVLKPENGAFKKIEEVNHLVKTDKELSETIKNLTGITEEKLINGIDKIDLYHEIMRLIEGNTLLVAYNIQFDINFVNALLKDYQPDYAFDKDMLDMLTIYKDNHKYPHKLSNAIDEYQIDFPNSHRALDDTLATAELFKVMHENESLNSYINVIGYIKKYGKKPPFFKHIRYVAQSYNIRSLRIFLEHRLF